jgi:hypothetical protein
MALDPEQLSTDIRLVYASPMRALAASQRRLQDRAV